MLYRWLMMDNPNDPAYVASCLGLALVFTVWALLWRRRWLREIDDDGGPYG